MLLISEFGELFVCVAMIIITLDNSFNFYAVLCLNVIIGISESFRFPAYSVITSSLLEADNYAKAHGLYMIVTALPAILAPFIGGILYDKISLTEFYLINLCTLLFSIFMIFRTEIADQSLKSYSKINFKEILSNTKENVFYLVKNKDISQLLILCSVFIFGFNLMNVLLPAMILSTYHKNTFIYGNLQMCFGMGGLIGAIFISIFGIQKSIVKTLKWSFILAYTGFILICFSNYVVICVLGIFLQAIFNQFIDACSQSWWQQKIPISRQGQIFALRRLVIWLFGCLGMGFAGIVDLFGIKTIGNNFSIESAVLFTVVIILFLITLPILKKFQVTSSLEKEEI